MYSASGTKPASAPAADLEDPAISDRLAVFLHPGRIYVSPAPSTVRMILGSCVAVCLWDPLHGVGGANHFLLPYHGQDDPRFGNVATERLMEKLLALGCSERNLRAKLFGGSCVLEAFQNAETHLGTKNVSVARTFLTHEGIPIEAEDVGGQHGRKVIFQTDDGSAWIRQL